MIRQHWLSPSPLNLSLLLPRTDNFHLFFVHSPGFHSELNIFHCQPSWSRGMNASFYFIKKNKFKPSGLAEKVLHFFCAFLSCRHSAKDRLTKLQQDLWNNSRKGPTWWALVPCWAHSCLGTAAPELLNLHAFLWKEAAVLKSGLVMEKQKIARVAGKGAQMQLSNHLFCIRGLHSWEMQRQMVCISLSPLLQS